MRFQVTLAAVVLGLSVATVTSARQQAGDSPRIGQAQAGPETAQQLQARVVELQAAMELLQVQHDANKAHLSAILNDMHQAERKLVSKETQQADSPAGRTAADRDAAVPSSEQTLIKLRAYADRVGQEFHQQAVRLHEMSFELADLQERLSHTS